MGRLNESREEDTMSLCINQDCLYNAGKCCIDGCGGYTSLECDDMQQEQQDIKNQKKLIKELCKLVESAKIIFEKILETIRGLYKKIYKNLEKQKKESTKVKRSNPLRDSYKIPKRIRNEYKHLSFKHNVVYRCRNNC